MLRTTVIVCGILLGLLVAAILIASGHGNVLAGLRHLIADPWGVVTLLDLGIGLLFVAVWLALVEPNPRWAAVWIVAPLAILGTVGLFFNLPVKAMLVLPIWGAIGLVVYFLYGYRTSHVGRGLFEVHEDDPDAPPRPVPPMPGADIN